MSKENELLPCPFCGGAVQFFQLGRDNTGDFYITCPKCEECEKAFESKEEAIKAWNRRVYPEDVQEAIDKQVPTKAELREVVEGTESCLCPSCGTFVENEGIFPYNFCTNCGQAIDWSEDNKYTEENLKEIEYLKEQAFEIIRKNMASGTRYSAGIVIDNCFLNSLSITKRKGRDYIISINYADLHQLDMAVYALKKIVKKLKIYLKTR